MKAITLWQPWATLIAIGAKRYETRSWPTRYRGPIAIHAAKRAPGDLELNLMLSLLASGRVPDLPAIDELPLGVIVATAELVNCTRMAGAIVRSQPELERDVGDWRTGRYAWELANVQALPTPIPARGAQGLWEWTPPAPAEFPLFQGNAA